MYQLENRFKLKTRGRLSL